MKMPMKQSNRTLPHQTGVPVDTVLKARLRHRSAVLTTVQLEVLKKMGVDTKEMSTEKEAVKIAKRIVNFESNYDAPGYISPWRRKVKSKYSNPVTMSKRQARIEVLMHRMDTPHTTTDSEGNTTKHAGSKRAAKQLKVL